MLKRGGLEWWEGVSGGICGGVCVEGETKFLPKVGLPFRCPSDGLVLLADV